MGSLSKYKVANLVLLFLVSLITIYSYYSLSIPCDGDFECRFEWKHSFLQPLYSGGLLLLAILAGLLLVPSDLFRKWLWYIFPIAMIHTVWWVSSISVYSGNILTPDRAQAAQSNMEFYGYITLAFVLGNLGFDWWKKYKNKKISQKA